METADTQAHCQYALLPNGIHELRIERSTRRAVDELFEHIEHINKITPSGELVRLLVNQTPSEIVPLSPLMAHVRTYDRKHTPAYRVVVLINGGTVVQLIGAFLKTLRLKRTELRFLNSSEHEQAIEWLLS